MRNHSPSPDRLLSVTDVSGEVITYHQLLSNQRNGPATTIKRGSRLLRYCRELESQAGDALHKGSVQVLMCTITLVSDNSRTRSIQHKRS